MSAESESYIDENGTLGARWKLKEGTYIYLQKDDIDDVWRSAAFTEGLAIQNFPAIAFRSGETIICTKHEQFPDVLITLTFARDTIQTAIITRDFQRSPVSSVLSVGYSIDKITSGVYPVVFGGSSGFDDQAEDQGLFFDAGPQEGWRIRSDSGVNVLTLYQKGISWYMGVDDKEPVNMNFASVGQDVWDVHEILFGKDIGPQEAMKLYDAMKWIYKSIYVCPPSVPHV